MVEPRARVVEIGVSVDVRKGGDLHQKIACSKHRNANEHEEDILKKAVGDVVRGKAMIF